MDPWVIWLLAAVVFAIGEIATTSFFLAPFSIGAASAAVVSRSVPARRSPGSSSRSSRPSSSRRAPGRPAAPAPADAERTGTAALIGRPAIVAERIANDEGTGCIKLDGEMWTARAYDEDRIFEPGTRVEVVEIRGATAIVDAGILRRPDPNGRRT